ncbi:hypothetical protein HYY71_00665 [Candidatus Woesearchaeota archaeon]|nr:hypothetical protein [Candidatus Woesearchaeota archaeon]
MGIQQEADEAARQIESVKETEEFRELELLHKTGIQHVDISSISKSIVGRTNINRHIKDMLSKAKSSVVVVSPQEHIERKVKLLKNFAPGFAKKGIKARLYGPFNKLISKKLQNVEHVEYSPSSSFVSVDSREMLFLVSSGSVVPDYEVAIWIDSPFFVNAVNVLFEESLK